MRIENDKKPIQGKIAVILDSERIAINRGRLHGVRTGMIFGIRLEIPKISDPDNPGLVLSDNSVFVEKGRMVASDVFDNMTFAKILPKGHRSALDVSEMFRPQPNFPNVEGAILTHQDWHIRSGDEIVQLSRLNFDFENAPLSEFNFNRWELEQMDSFKHDDLARGLSGKLGQGVGECKVLIAQFLDDAEKEYDTFCEYLERRNCKER